MLQPRAMLLDGTIDRVRIQGNALLGNVLSDPVERELIVYLPPSYTRSKHRYPVLFVLPGYGSTHQSLLNFKPWEPTFLERYERLLAQGCREAIVVLPDCFTRFGGSQFLDSPALGDYQRYLADDIVPFVDQRYRTLPKREARAIVGKSSGGFGALRMGIDRPERFAVLGSHSGDCAFEVSVRPRFAEVAAVYEKYGGAASFASAVHQKGGPSSQREFHAIEYIAMACAYAPTPAPARDTQGAHDAGPPMLGELPFDPYTAEVRPAAWERWLAHDPVIRCETRVEALCSARLVFLDAGKFDEYGLQFGARMLAQRLNNLGVTVHHEEFEGGHMGTSHRYDVSLPKLLSALEEDSFAGARERL